MLETKIACRVRPGLVVALSENLIHSSGTELNLSAIEFERHKVQLETEEQYQSRLKALKAAAKKTTSKEDK